MELRCPDHSLETLSSPLCRSSSITRVLTRGPGRKQQEEVGAGCGNVVLVVLRRWVGGGSFTGTQRQDLVKIKPHPVVSPRDGAGGRWVAVIPCADVTQR